MKMIKENDIENDNKTKYYRYWSYQDSFFCCFFYKRYFVQKKHTSFIQTSFTQTTFIQIQSNELLLKYVLKKIKLTQDVMNNFLLR